MNSEQTLNEILSHNHQLFFKNLAVPTVEMIECRDLLNTLQEETGLVGVFLEEDLPPNPDEWDVVVNAQKLKNIQLFERGFAGNNRPIVFFSGGLESTFLALACPNARFIHVTDIVAVADDYQLPLCEPLFALICRALGHTTYFTGQEFMPEDNVPDHLVHCANNWMAVWASYVGVTQVSPVIYAEKYDLYRRAQQLGMRFYSCDESDGEWCGECFKCFQLNSFGRWSGLKLVPYTGDAAATDSFIAEIEEYAQTGIDKYMGDNNTFLFCEQQTGISLRTLYKDKL